mmetsp:Transcript_27825/g.91056  ORF Transcript_27825/g.91056 Transcript_27825/m.91056 type:complete len:322 (-) Transcript_27825:482-1447(-)
MFISSPSKSALYGDVTERLSRKVEYGMMRTRWPMMDILCSEGWRLNTTSSPSIIWRSTLYPYSSVLSESFKKRKSMRCPSVRMMYLAPVCPSGGSGPLVTSFWRRSLLYGVTVSGKVMLSAMERGTPSSSRARLGSGVMTERAEKSTRLPMRLPRIRPDLPLRRSEMLFTGRPLLRLARGMPAMLLSKNVVTWYCNSSVSSVTTCAGAPFCSSLRRLMLVRVISWSLEVRSSSLRIEALNATLGRTWGGGMGITTRMRCSGRVCFGSSPIAMQSSSEMPLKIWSTFSAVSVILRSCGSGMSASSCALRGRHSAVILCCSMR